MDEEFVAHVNALIPSYEPPDTCTLAEHEAQYQEKSHPALVESRAGRAWAKSVIIAILAVGATTALFSLGSISALEFTFRKPVWPLFIAVGLAARWGEARAAWLVVFASVPAMLLVSGPPHELAKDCVVLLVALGIVVACLVNPERRLRHGFRRQARSVRLTQSLHQRFDNIQRAVVVSDR